MLFPYSRFLVEQFYAIYFIAKLPKGGNFKISSKKAFKKRKKTKFSEENRCLF